MTILYSMNVCRLTTPTSKMYPIVRACPLSTINEVESDETMDEPESQETSYIES